MKSAPRTIPIVQTRESGDCDGGESFALMVLGDSMTPEFDEGDIVVVEPDGLAHDGSFVIAAVAGEWTLRQLRGDRDGWTLRALNVAYPLLPLATLDAIRGVVIQKTRPGRRRATKRYIE